MQYGSGGHGMQCTIPSGSLNALNVAFAWENACGVGQGHTKQLLLIGTIRTHRWSPAAACDIASWRGRPSEVIPHLFRATDALRADTQREQRLRGSLPRSWYWPFAAHMLSPSPSSHALRRSTRAAFVTQETAPPEMCPLGAACRHISTKHDVLLREPTPPAWRSADSLQEQLPP
ncbi:hypothetical protein BD413DRAFT_67423 [Trametes elegans]|nr:hypothetical protein BD413DRAFT_67423 [Trametes elegans]